MLLMVQKSQTTTWDGAKTAVNNGISNLGAGNSKIFYFHPEPWGNDQI